MKIKIIQSDFFKKCIFLCFVFSRIYRPSNLSGDLLNIGKYRELKTMETRCSIVNVWFEKISITPYFTCAESN